MPIQIQSLLNSILISEKLVENSDGLKPWELQYMIDCITKSKNAYLWAKEYPRYREELKSKINSEKYAIKWGRLIGRDEEIRDVLSSDEMTFKWAKMHPEDRDKLRHKISSNSWKVKWVRALDRDREFMRQRLDEKVHSQVAFQWAANVGDVKDMRKHVEAMYWKRTWNGHFSDHEQFEDIGFHDIDPKFHSTHKKNPNSKCHR